MSMSVTRRAWIALGFAFAFVLAGGMAFSATQGKGVLVGMYWAMTTASTVGYGDVSPHNTAGRLLAMAMMLTAIPALAAVYALLTGSHLSTRVTHWWDEHGARHVTAETDRAVAAGHLLLAQRVTELQTLVEALQAEVGNGLLADIRSHVETMSDHLHERLDSIEQTLNDEDPQ
jgi:Ion channel